MMRARVFAVENKNIIKKTPTHTHTRTRDMHLYVLTQSKRVRASVV